MPSRKYGNCKYTCVCQRFSFTSNCLMEARGHPFPCFKSNNGKYRVNLDINYSCMYNFSSFSHSSNNDFLDFLGVYCEEKSETFTES